MSNPVTQDIDILKTIWSRINAVCVPPSPPDEPAKMCFLMEMPGFSIDPDAFDELKFNPYTMMSPECATASLCDRVPILAPYFYDTGDHISFYWKLLLETFTVEDKPEKTTELETDYEKAIKMLYGSPDAYISQQKTSLYLDLDKLREQWEAAIKVRDDFKKEMQRDKVNWPGNYEKCAAPFIDAVEDAYGEYNKLRLQIQKYEDIIFSYPGKDLNILLMKQANSE